MRLAVAAAVMALGACVSVPPPLVQGPVLRDQSALIGVTSRYDARRFEGVWYVRAGFEDTSERVAFRLSDTPTGPVMRLGATVCDAAGNCGDVSQDLAVTPLGRGQFSVRMPDGQTREFWVLWVDEGFRTAALGNNRGDFGWIVDRSTSGGGDRIAAAREILDFNGYDVSQLKVVE
jgi:apolipoprotein D and lipocalin family protein